MSDAERDQVVARLNTALGEGRLTLDEFEERVGGVLQARTYGEVEPYVSDLPGLQPGAPAVVELRNNASSLKRNGRWAVPRRLVVHNKAGSVKLNFVDALIPYPTIEIDVDVIAGSVDLVVPRGASADVDAVEMFAGSVKSTVPRPHDAAATGPMFLVTGQNKAGSVRVRHERRFLRWRW
jgi:hypothetical protein